MKILISNDDGIESPGIQALAKSMAMLGEVTVVAPTRERSTSGHSLTLHKPLRIIPYQANQFATSGSPADCIYLGMREVMKTRPDIIVSGINRGANLGTDIHYSGTVAAAREAALMNIKSYAFSVVPMPEHPDAFKDGVWDFSIAAEIARRVVEATLNESFPAHTLLNVNVPHLPQSSIRGIRITTQGFRYYKEEVMKREDPRGRPYYWIGGPYKGFEKSESSDCHAVEQGFAAITPVTIDCTHQGFYASLKAKSLWDSLLR